MNVEAGVEALVILARLLRVERPLVSLDLETTGPVVSVDRIVQLGVLKVYPDGRVTSWSSYVDPQVPIPAGATQVHKISEAELAGAPTFKDLATKLYVGLDDVDFVGFNVRDFDLPLLAAEFARCGITWDWSKAYVVDAYKLFALRERRTLTAALKFYLNEELTDAHDAFADAAASARVLLAQLETYDDLPRDVAQLATVCFPRDTAWVDRRGKVVWRGLDACLNFGKWTGTPLRTVPRDYLSWLAEKSDVAPEVKEIARRAAAGVYPQKGV